MTTLAKALYVQRRPTRAGAQTSLSRLIASSPHQTLTLCAQNGWLTEALENTIVSEWPSPRSLPARLGGLKRFAAKLAKRLDTITVVVANDHHECPIALAIAKCLAIPCIAILRTPGMSRGDFEKYKCDDFDHLFVVGEELQSKIRQWSNTPISPFNEGFLESEFSQASFESPRFPDAILVAGSEEPRKGFSDFIDALTILQKTQPNIGIKKVCFTGKVPDGQLPDLDCELAFVGRVTDFIPFARQFDFAVHPSRHETFGLAPLELMIAGIPTLCTETGCANEDLLPKSWLIPPSSPEALAAALQDWQRNWSSNHSQLPEVSRRIHERFAISTTSRDFFATIEKLSSAS